MFARMDFIFNSDDELQMQEHPWLARMAEKEEEDSLDEMLRYALDELRFA